jgi:hypothetical protein
MGTGRIGAGIITTPTIVNSKAVESEAAPAPPGVATPHPRTAAIAALVPAILPNTEPETRPVPPG